MSSLPKQYDETMGLREINLNFKEMLHVNLGSSSKIVFAYFGFIKKNKTKKTPPIL